MSRREFMFYVLSIIFATAWELILAYNSRFIGRYYVKRCTIFFENWTGGAGRPCVSWSKYSPSPEFVLLVLLPALVLLILYLWFRKPALKKSAVSISLPILSVIIGCFKTKGPGVLLVLLVVSLAVSGVAGKDKWEKVLLSIAGFLPGLIVSMMIAAELTAVSC
ncbi:hypothetical protein NF865_07655 [Thermococcus aggregans]|uniref:Uncharacterized protein n=1 Tax=Thermococcus aggregans TaxID=110163 RepID=A0A9E7MWH5_THEAG|nr:hypothetical protein [Thermococcus aggregans]USS40201.1 hypothetical protein NF865_07655 [Thermococcus aggregans]